VFSKHKENKIAQLVYIRTIAKGYLEKQHQ